MDFDLATGTAILERTPGTLRAMLDGLPATWTDATEGPETWSPYVIVGHLIHGERTDWIPRARIILAPGTDRRFTPYDRFAQFRESRGKSLGDLLDEFAALRRENLATLAGWNLTEEQIKTVLWAVGEFACRARDDDFVPVAMDADPPKVATWKLNHPRQLAALRILVQMRTSKRPTFDEALDTIRDSRALMDVLHLAKNIHIPLEPLTMPTTEPTPVTHEYPDVYDCGSWPAHGTEHGKDLPTICNELHAKGREVVQAWDHHGDGNRGWTVLHRARAK